MLMNAAPRLITIPELVSWINFTVAGMSSASSCREYSRFAGSFRCPLRRMLSMISSHFDKVRDAMQISPSTSLFIAAL